MRTTPPTKKYNANLKPKETIDYFELGNDFTNINAITKKQIAPPSATNDEGEGAQGRAPVRLNRVTRLGELIPPMTC